MVTTRAYQLIKTKLLNRREIPRLVSGVSPGLVWLLLNQTKSCKGRCPVRFWKVMSASPEPMGVPEVSFALLRFGAGLLELHASQYVSEGRVVRIF